MRCLIFFCVTLGFLPVGHASFMNNGVILTAKSIETILNESDENSLYRKCQAQPRGFRFLSNACTQLVESLRKKMDTMTLESDLQMQAERISKHPKNDPSTNRIAMLAKINLLATQAEDAIKASLNNSKANDIKESLTDILPAVKKVQIAFKSYSKLLPHE